VLAENQPKPVTLSAIYRGIGSTGEQQRRSSTLLYITVNQKIALFCFVLNSILANSHTPKHKTTQPTSNKKKF
jgi:hypothetical protein